MNGRHPPAQVIVEKTIAEADVLDYDGRISFEEFCQVCVCDCVCDSVCDSVSVCMRVCVTECSAALWCEQCCVLTCLCSPLNILQVLNSTDIESKMSIGF